MSAHTSVIGIPKFTSEQLAYLASLKKENPGAFEAVTTQKTHPMAALMAQSAKQPAATKPSEPVTMPKVGDLVADRGVYLGPWEAAPGHTVHAYAADDCLRDAKGNQLVMNFNEATKEFANRNDGRRYGDGSEANIRQAIAQGTYQEGDLILPPKALLNGYDVQGNHTHPVGNIYTLMNNGHLPKVAAAVRNGEGDQKWAISGSEHPVNASRVYHASLTYGGGHWINKVCLRSAVVPVRFFRQPAASGPAPQVGG